MGRSVFVNSVLLFVAHSMSAGNLTRGTGLVSRAGQRSVTKGFRPVPSPFREQLNSA